jgi:predicted nucleotidyltransferase
MEREALLKRVKEVVQSFDPEAEIILYGSRARGDWTEDSDWDLLVLYSGPEDLSRERALCDAIYDVELEADALITAVIHDKTFWKDPVVQASPFYEAVVADGIGL